MSETRLIKMTNRKYFYGVIANRKVRQFQKTEITTTMPENEVFAQGDRIAVERFVFEVKEILESREPKGDYKEPYVFQKLVVEKVNEDE